MCVLRPHIPPSTGSATCTSECSRCDECEEYYPILIIVIVAIGSFLVGVLLTMLGGGVKKCIGKAISL